MTATSFTKLLRLLTLAMLWAATPAGAAHAGGAAIDFNRDVRPVLSDACFHCHGRDAEHREADLRLDAWQDEESSAASDVITPGDPSASELIERLVTDDPDLRMPPPDSGKTITPEQIEVLKQWVAGGAQYKRHWAFEAPVRPELPETKHAEWARNPIDHFVAARLEQEGLAPSPAADGPTLLRRLCLDLTGLPPTLRQLAWADRLPEEDAYNAVVDELVGSPHYGEHWARWWLDAASYADSNGYEKDRNREVWMYRDWVVAAFNDNLPYDRFVKMQVAGDLTEGTAEARLAPTGFLRNTMVNEEGGIDPQQFRMEQLFARIDILGKSVLGLTMQCAQCHTHKYDPISHTEYYQMLALINDAYESSVTLYPPEQKQQRDAVLARISELERRLQADHPEWREDLQAWAAEHQRLGPPNEWSVIRPELDGSGGQKLRLLPNGAVLAEGYAPAQLTTDLSTEVKAGRISAVRLELLTHPTLPRQGPGRSEFGLCALTDFELRVEDPTADGGLRRLAIDRAYADVEPRVSELAAKFDDGSGKRRVTGPIGMAIDGDKNTAWGIDIGPGRSNQPRTAVFVLKEPLICDGPTRLSIKLVQVHGQTYHKDLHTNNLGCYRLSVTGDPDPTIDPLSARVRRLIEKSADQWSDAERNDLLSSYRATRDDWADVNEEIEAAWADHPQGVAQLVLERREVPRVTHRLERGEYTKPAEEVHPGVPAFLHPLASEAPNRLALAEWLVDRRSPTTARTVVNRVWQSVFGVGLVETPGDFGLQGAAPSHPELLDWLAVELMDSDWDLQHIVRLIVDSATYRQSSRVTRPLIEQDPHNRLLARGARYRVNAEAVRDIALAASGLLNRKTGGPGVCPPAPEYLFHQPASYTEKWWDFEPGDSQYRRALYTFRYRTLLYPVYQNFDAPTGETACVRRDRSNTPLQALTLLNEPLFFECAQTLAERLLERSGDDSERIERLYARCLGRRPADAEVGALLDFAAKQAARYQSKELAPRTEIVAAAEASPRYTARELAVWTAVSRVVLNLDETISRE
ncbi:Planctomycete cytochrome C [Posidoniimonas polymericola]|uniref:Planctomycete cytochrome C n=1 Tax=Posidoniimonas polymericola TaxID=2528002 RepID=A0A5C5ZF02_9BACT|nr:PSD1 and planctomycete cytochrome C domain-containing protein [Posidoniimonas polymericola]TWT86019.1 Planctomycete cytochrome C [Posidoniimonas polymericola]